jgi:hypothetical protein
MGAQIPPTTYSYAELNQYWAAAIQNAINWWNSSRSTYRPNLGAIRCLDDLPHEEVDKFMYFFMDVDKKARIHHSELCHEWGYCGPETHNLSDAVEQAYHAIIHHGWSHVNLFEVLQDLPKELWWDKIAEVAQDQAKLQNMIQEPNQDQDKMLLQIQRW